MGDNEIDADDYLKPHTRAWFAVLDARNWRQATMSRLAVEVGGVDGCSFCGDIPSEPYILPAARTSVRLCAECRTIRGNMHGEHYQKPPQTLLDRWNGSGMYTQTGHTRVILDEESRVGMGELREATLKVFRPRAK